MSDLPQRLRRLLTAASALESAAPPEDEGQRPGVGSRLRDSVLRPLRQIHGATANGDEPAVDEPEPSGGSAGGEVEARNSTQHVSDRVWELARAATELRAEVPDLPELAEATA